MQTVSLILFATLIAIGALHAYWALGGLWPAGSERALIDMVVGNAAMTKMPGMAATLVVAGLLFITALIALAAGRVIGFGPVWITRLAAIGVASVFLARGAAGYFFETIAWKPVEPFATLNVWVYSPLCLLIAAAFFVLALAPDD